MQQCLVRVVCGFIVFACGWSAVAQSPSREYAAGQRGGADGERLPNIVFIMADDLGYGDLGCYGQTRIRTPRVDGLAAEGVLFETCYTGAPICAPSRDALMTGRHSGHLDRRDNQARAHREELAERGLVPLPAEAVTIAAVLRERGYATGGFGKWGLGNPGTTGVPWLHGFDDWVGYLDQRHAHDFYTPYLMHNDRRVELPGNEGDGEAVYSADFIHEQSLAWVRANADGPFFLYLAYTLPHGQFEVPELGAYAAEDWPARQRTYAAMVTRMDAHVGGVLDLLDELGLAEDTIVFFTSDHGPVGWTRSAFDGTLGQRGGKSQVYEGGLRVPMVVRWPGEIEAGVVSETVWWLPDFFPTACELAGAAVPESVDGVSVLPVLRGETRGEAMEERAFYWEFYSPFQQAVRLGGFKGVRLGTAEPIALYDLTEDPNETTDVAAAHPGVVARMEAVMRESRTENRYWPTVERRQRRRGGGGG